MILAQYTIRSKQEYIFKTNRVLEIVGASENIARIWDVMFEVARNKGLKYECSDMEFSFNDVKSKFENGSLNFVELFCGGGNETVLFDGKESFVKLNKAFSYKIIDDYPGMIPMVVYVEVSGNYSDDYRRLMSESDKKKNIMEPIWNMFTVPFAMMDRSTFQPYSRVINIGKTPVRMSDESYSKYKTGKKLRDDNDEIRLFDEMVTQKGKESLLAVVHADGNNMGAKIMGMLRDEQNYDIAVKLMRKFTKTTADCFEKEGERALREYQKELKEKNKSNIESGKLKESSLFYRRIIGSGDDVTFICNARFVMEYVQAYLNAVQNYHINNKSEWKYSSCAGICIFHSHYPFSTAYSIAEKACDDSAKEKVHVTDGSGSVVEQGWMDFHFVHSGIGGDLKEIRESQGTADCIARPWLVTCNSDDADAKHAEYKYADLLSLKSVFEEIKYKNKEQFRSAIKSIGSAYERNKAAAKKEWTTFEGHNPEVCKMIADIFTEEDKRFKALYDFAEIYDLWFTEVK